MKGTIKQLGQRLMESFQRLNPAHQKQARKEMYEKTTGQSYGDAITGASEESHMEKRIGINELAKIIADGEPEAHVEVLNYDDMVFLFKIGSAPWWLWGGSYLFHHIVDTHGTEADKVRLSNMNLGYQYEHAPSELTLSESDVILFRACGIEVEHRPYPLRDRHRKAGH